MTNLADYHLWKARQQRSGIGAAQIVLGANERPPDQAAGDLQTASAFSRSTGQPSPPIELVREFPDIFRNAVERDRQTTALSRAPKLTDWLRAPENAAVSRDDLEGLSWWETGLRAAANAALERGGLQIGQSYHQRMASSAAQRLADEDRSFLEIWDDERSRPMFDWGPFGNSSILDATVGPLTDAGAAGVRFAQSRLPGLLGGDNELAARYHQQRAFAVQQTVEDTARSPGAVDFGQAAYPKTMPVPERWQQYQREMLAWDGTDEPPQEPDPATWVETALIRSDIFFNAIVDNPAGAAAFFAEAGLESIPRLLAGVAAGAVTRSPSVGAGVMFGATTGTVSGLETTETLREWADANGVDIGSPEGVLDIISNDQLMRDAMDRGLTRGVVISLFETLGFVGANRVLSESPMANALLQVVLQAVAGGAGEAAGTIAVGEEVDIRDVLVEALASGMIDTPTLVGGAGIIRWRQYQHNRRQAQAAEASRSLFEQLSGQAVQSPTRNRMPQAFQDYVARATENGPVENIYIPADRFVEYFQGQGVDPYEIAGTLANVSRDDVRMAVETGGDVQIPTATYAAHMAGSEHDAFVIENMRFDPDEFTSREAQEFNARAQEALEEAYRVAEQARIENEQLRSFEQEIYETMLGRLRQAGRGTDVAQAEAMLYPAFYRVMAERSGLTTEEFMRRYPLPRVRGDLPEGMQAQNVDALNRTLAEARVRREAVFAGAQVEQISGLDEIEAYLHDLGVSLDDSDTAIRQAIEADQDAQRQALGQENRGSISLPLDGVAGGEAVIRLMASADLSTFLHESGHYFLAVMQDLAGRGEEQASRDYAQIRVWWRENAESVARDAMRAHPDVTVTAADVRRAVDEGMTGDAVRDRAIEAGAQEQFARAFEAYLMEGRAPSFDLQSAFDKFRAWLVAIYRRAIGLDVTVSADLRAVLNRMIATDSEIASAQDRGGDGGPIFTTAEEMGLTPEQFEAFNRLHEQARGETQARLLAEAMAPVRREREKWYQTERANMRFEVERNVNAMPTYRAIEWLGNRRWLGEDAPDGLPDMRMSKAILVQRYGEGVLKTLPRGRQTVYAVEGGLDPDEVAGWFGFRSGDELVQAMERAPRRVRAIEDQTDREMFDRHGDVMRDGTMEAEALDAVHNDKRAQALGRELKALVDVAQSDRGLTHKEARAIARQTLSRMNVRDAMNANRFLTAERKAAQEAQRLAATVTRTGMWMDAARRRVGVDARAAVREGDAAAALRIDTDPANRRTLRHNENVAKLIEAKRRQLLNHQMYAEARRVADEVEAVEKLVANLSKASTRRAIAASGREGGSLFNYLEAIDEILDRHDFRKVSGRAEERRGALNAYVERMKAEGRENELSIPDHVLQNAARVPYKRLSVEHLRGVADSLRNIEHTANRWNTLLDAKDRRVFNDVIEQITESFDKNMDKRPPSRVAQASEVRHSQVRKFLDLVLNAGTLLREIDGFEDYGAAYRNIKAPVDDAMNRLTTRRQKAAEDLDGLYSVYSADERRRMNVREQVPALGYAISKWERIAIALNTGNEGNFQRLTDGNVRGSLTEAQVQAVLATLDERDARFVQSVWDYLESFRSDIEAREKRTTGVAPNWVEGRPVTIAGQELRGGYYPLRYDPRLTTLSRDDQVQDIATALQAGRFGKAQTRNGHLKERASASGRAVELDMAVLHKHVNQVVYDLELSEAVTNSWRILQDKRLRDQFIQAGRQADFDALETWLKDMAEGELRSADWVGQAARKFKSNFTAAKLAFNLSTVAIQLTGVAQSMVVVGKRDFVKGTVQMMRPGVLDDITAKSTFMRHRQTTFNKDIFDFYNDPKMGPASSRWTSFKQNILGPLSFWMMTKVQYFAVDAPTWLAAYEQGLRKFSNNEAQAISHADAVVRRTQASGLFSDRSAVERGSVSAQTRQNDVIRLFTALGSYMFAKFNVAYERSARAQRTIRDEGVSMRSVQEALSWTLDMAFLFTLEAVLYAAIKGRLPDSEDEDDDWGSFLVRETAFSIMSSIPFVRDIGGSMSGFSGGGSYGAITDELSRPFIQSLQGEVDRALVKSIINSTGLMTGIPATQINRAVDAAWRQMEGDDVSPAEYLLGRIGR